MDNKKREFANVTVNPVSQQAAFLLVQIVACSCNLIEKKTEAGRGKVISPR